MEVNKMYKNKIFPVIFTWEELNRITNSKGTMFTGNLNEAIVMHIIQQLPHITECSYIKNPKQNRMQGDIRFKYKKQKHHIEVKTGAFFNNRYKLAIDTKYVHKYEPLRRYTLSTSVPWLNIRSYDLLAVVFSHRVYIIHSANELLQKVYGEVKEVITDNLIEQWYNSYDTPLFEGATGSMNRNNPYYDTYQLNIDLDIYLTKHNINYTLLEYDTKAIY